MATLPPPKVTSGFGRFDPAPKGMGIWTCLKVHDEFNVERKRFNSDEVYVTDVTRFLFGTIDKSGKQWFVQSREMRISSDPRSTLFQFLKSWLGEAPRIGWDYCEMIGTGALISVEHVESTHNPGEMFARIAAIAPVLPDLASKVPPLEKFGIDLPDDLEAAGRDNEPF